MRLILSLLLLLSGSADAQDALRGKRLYLDAARVVGSAVSCVDCHGGLPGGLFGIERTANNPAAVRNAIDTIPQMTPFRGRLTAIDYADLAACIGNPAIPSPEVRITTSLPGGGAGAADRIEFGELAAGQVSSVATLRIANAGAVPFTLAWAPQLAGTNASEFSIEATDCATGAVLPATQSCRVDLRFRPGGAPGAPGARTARVSVTHDWVGGVAAVALLGRVPAAQPPAPQAAADGGGVFPIAGLLLLLPACARRRQAAVACTHHAGELRKHSTNSGKRRSGH